MLRHWQRNFSHSKMARKLRADSAVHVEGPGLHGPHAGAGEAKPLSARAPCAPHRVRQHLVVHGSDVALSLGYSLLGRWVQHGCGSSDTNILQSLGVGHLGFVCVGCTHSLIRLRFCRCVLVPPQLLQVLTLTQPQPPVASQHNNATLPQRVVPGFPPPPPPHCTIQGDAGLFYVLMEPEGLGFSVLKALRFDGLL